MPDSAQAAQGSSKVMDERIVAAKFDSSDFEKGVDKTVKKLDELKSSLNIKDGSKSITEISEKTNKATESMSENMDKLTNRLTTFTGMVKQKLLSGLADQVVNTFFRMEHAVTGFFRSMTTGQIDAGMAKYEAMLTSVRMITTAYKDRANNIKYTQDEAYDAMEDLQTYADETSYSLSQMTDAMSKMVAAGVDLETAKKNVQGIANACAVAGVNATDASRAFFNLAQAYSSGGLKYTDYRSLQLLNMTNENFEEQLLKAGVAAGTLKETKAGSGIYKTKKSKTNKKVTAGKTVTRKNLSDSLKYNFIDNEAMNQLFGTSFFIDVDEYKKLRKELGSSEAAYTKLIETYGDVAVSAFKAAREARNFTDVLNTVRDAVSTGWSQAFQKLFGTLEQATEFFTELSEGGIATFFYDISDWINETLDVWNEGIGDSSGGAQFREALLEVDSAFGTLFSLITDFLPTADEFGEQLFFMTSNFVVASRAFHEWADNVHAWFMNTGEDHTISNMERIQEIVGNLASVFGIAAKMAGIAFNAFNDIFGLLAQPGGVLETLIGSLQTATKPLDELNKNTGVFKDLEYSVTNLIDNAISPALDILTPVIGLLGEVANFFLSSAIDTAVVNINFFSDALGLFLELIGVNSAQKIDDGIGVIGKIKNEFENIKTAVGNANEALKRFFETLVGDIRNILGLAPAKGQENAEGGIFAGVQNFFNTDNFMKSAETWFADAKVNIGRWFNELPRRITMFFTSFLYQPVAEQGTGVGAVMEYDYKLVETPLKQWLDGAVTTVSNFIADIPGNLMNGVGKVTDFFGNIVHAIFGGDKGEGSESEAQQNAISAIQEWSNTFQRKMNLELKMLPIRLRIFMIKQRVKFKFMWKDIKNWFNESETIKTIQGWGATIGNAIKNFILDIPNLITSAIKTAGSIGRTIVSAIKTFFSADSINEAAEDEARKITFQGVIDAIKDIGLTLVNEIISLFSGTDDIEENIAWFGETVGGFIKGIPDKIRTGASWAIHGLVSLWENVYNHVMGISGTDQQGNEVARSKLQQKINELTGDGDGSVVKYIESIPELLDAAVTDIGTSITHIWDRLMYIINGGVPENKVYQGGVFGALEKESLIGDSEPGKFEQMATSLSKSILGIFQSIPGWITDGLTGVVTAVDGAISLIDGAISKSLAESTDGTAEKVAENLEGTDGSDEKTLASSIVKLGESIQHLITGTLPGMIGNAFTWIGTKYAEDWKPALLGIFDGINNNPELQEKVAAAGETIVAWIRDLPNKIAEAFKIVRRTINQILGQKITDPTSQYFGMPVSDPFNTKGQLDEVGKETEDAAKQSTLLSTLSGIAGDIGTALSGTFDTIGPTVIDVFKQIPTWITTGITFAIDGISEAIGKLTEWLKRDELTGGLTEGLSKEVADAIQNDTKDLGKEVTDAVGESTKDADPEKSNALVTGIKNIGKALWNLIGNVIPGFISAGFEYIKTHYTDWIQPLNTLFDAVVGEDGLNINTEGLGEEIKKKILELPNTIRNAFETAKTMDEAGKETKDAIEGSSFWDEVGELSSAIGDTILAVFDEIGPYFIRGWNNSLKFIEKLLSAMSQVFTGVFGDLGEAVGKTVDGDVSDDTKNALVEFGETIRAFFVDTVPRFIGSAIGELLNILPDMVHTFWEGLSEAFGKKPKDDKVAGTAENAITDSISDPLTEAGEAAKDAVTKGIDTTSQILDQIVGAIFTKDDEGNINGTTIWAKMALIALILTKISDFINGIRISNPETAEAKNSIMGVLRTAMEALMLGMVFATLASQMNDTQFDHAMTAFDKLGELITTVMEKMQWIAGLQMGSSIAEAVGDVAGAVGDIKGKAGGEKLGLKGLIAKLTGGAVSGGIKAAGTYAIVSELGSVFTTVGAAVAQIGTSLKTFASELGEATRTMITIEPDITIATTCIGEISTLLETFKDLEQYESMVSNITAFVLLPLEGVFAGFAEASKGDIHAEEITKSIKDLIGMTGEMTEFADWANDGDTFSRFKNAISSLGSALSFYHTGAFSQTGTYDETGISNALKFLKAILGDEELVGLADYLKDTAFDGDLTEMQANSEKMIVFAGAIAKLGAAASEFTEDTGTNINSFIHAMDDIDYTGMLFGNDEEVTSFANKMLLLGQGLMNFALASNQMTPENMDMALRALNVLREVAKESKSFENGVALQWLVGNGDLATFATNIKTLGTNLSEFMASVSNPRNSKGIRIKPNLEYIQDALMVVTQLSTAATRVKNGDVEQLSTLLYRGSTFGRQIYLFIDQISAITQLENLKDENGKIDFTYIYDAVGSFLELSKAASSLGQINVKKVLGDLEDDNKGLPKLAEKIVETFTTLGTFVGNKIMVPAEDVDDTTSEVEVTVEQIEHVINIVNGLFNAMAAMYTMPNVFEGNIIMDGRGAMENIIYGLQVLNTDFTTIETFIEKMSSITGNENLKTAHSLTLLLQDIGTALGMFSTDAYTNNNPALDGLTNMMTINPDTLSQALSNILYGFKDMIQDEDNLAAFGEIGTTIAQQIFQGVQAAFDDPNQDLQPKITPVLDMSQVSLNMGELTGEKQNGGRVTIDFGSSFTESLRTVFNEQEKPVIPDYTDQFTSMQLAVNGLSADIQSVASAVASYRMYLDTGVLVGALGPGIDAYLGRSGDLYLRRNTTGSDTYFDDTTFA